MNTGAEKSRIHNISVEITFEYIYIGEEDEFIQTSVECVFWDTQTRAWNGTGCGIVSTCSHRTTCLCQHLTNFAVLMDFNSIFSKSSRDRVSSTGNSSRTEDLTVGSNTDTSDSNTSYDFLSLLTVICSSLTIIFLCFSLWIFTCVPSLKSDRTSIHANLCLCLLIAHLLLLTGLDSTSLHQLCYSIAVCLHYFFLASFTWMMSEGWHIYRLLTEVWQTQRCGMLPYYLIGYVLPLVIVIITIICNEVLALDGYGTENHCWLSSEHGFIWAFMGPVAAVIGVNLVIFLMAMKVARKAISRNNNLDTKAEIVTQMKGCMSLVSILGISWFSGFFYFNSSLSWVGVIFTITNSLQGVAIFIFHVILNDKVRKKLLSYLQRRFQVIHEDALSRADTTKRTVRRKYLGRYDTELSMVDNSITETTITSTYDDIQGM